MVLLCWFELAIEKADPFMVYQKKMQINIILKRSTPQRVQQKNYSFDIWSWNILAYAI